jgi:succinyl-diaminopimelate desuccinylase
VLDLKSDVVKLTTALVDIRSVSRNEEDIANVVFAALRDVPHLTVTRYGNTVVARTSLGHSSRVVIAGHLDTVPYADNLPAKLDGTKLYGLGACDMKGGVAVGLRLAATIAEPTRDVTYVFYDCEEIEAEYNGLGRLARTSPDVLAGDFAVLMEPTSAQVEGGCQGTLRAEIRVPGKRSHSARSWMGSNAIHSAGAVLATLTSYEPRQVPIDGLVYREGLNAVGISGGVAGNVIPDECRISVNYRFAPDLDEEQAFAHVRSVFEGYDVVLLDSSPAAMPGLSHPAAAAFVAAVGAEPRPKFGWTDVARFTELKIPAVNYGPGDSLLAHTKDEFVEVGELRQCEDQMRAWLCAS